MSEMPSESNKQGVFATVGRWIQNGFLDRLPPKIEGETEGLPWEWNTPATGLRQLYAEIQKTKNAQRKRELMVQLRDLAQDVRTYLQSQGILDEEKPVH